MWFSYNTAPTHKNVTWFCSNPGGKTKRGSVDLAREGASSANPPWSVCLRESVISASHTDLRAQCQSDVALPQNARYFCLDVPQAPQSLYVKLHSFPYVPPPHSWLILFPNSQSPNQMPGKLPQSPHFRATSNGLLLKCSQPPFSHYLQPHSLSWLPDLRASMKGEEDGLRSQTWTSTPLTVCVWAAMKPIVASVSWRWIIRCLPVSQTSVSPTAAQSTCTVINIPKSIHSLKLKRF